MRASSTLGSVAILLTLPNTTLKNLNFGITFGWSEELKCGDYWLFLSFWREYVLSEERGWE